MWELTLPSYAAEDSLRDGARDWQNKFDQQIWSFLYQPLNAIFSKSRLTDLFIYRQIPHIQNSIFSCALVGLLKIVETSTSFRILVRFAYSESNLFCRRKPGDHISKYPCIRIDDPDMTTVRLGTSKSQAHFIRAWGWCKILFMFEKSIEEGGQKFEDQSLACASHAWGFMCATCVLFTMWA